MKLAGRKSALTTAPPSPAHHTPALPPPLRHAMGYCTDRSKAVVVPVLVLLFVALWFILRGDLFESCLVLFCSCIFFSPFSIVITSLGEERYNLSVFRTFVRFALVWFYLFPLPLRAWDGLWLVIVALPGLFSYLRKHLL